MTPESNDAVQELMAGRELDTLVAEKVMGWTYRESKHGHFIVTAPDGTITEPAFGLPKFSGATGDPIVYVWHDFVDLPEYSTDIAAAWLVVEKLRERFDTVIIESCLDGFCVRIGDYEAPAPLVHMATDPRQGGVALTICLASLQAVASPPSA